MLSSHGWKSARLTSMHASLVLSTESFELSARQVASARNAHSCVQCFVCCGTQWIAHSLTTQCCASPQWIGCHMHVSQCQMRERRSPRTLPNVALRDTNWRAPHGHFLNMIQSGRIRVQMTEHIILLRDANIFRTWYTTTIFKGSCGLSWCLQQVNSLSVQSRYNAVEAWIVLRHRSRVNIADLFQSNEVSGARAAALFEDAGAAGVAHVQDLRNFEAPENPVRATQEAQQVAEGVLCWHSRVDAEHAGGRGATSAVFACSRDLRCHWPALG